MKIFKIPFKVGDIVKCAFKAGYLLDIDDVIIRKVGRKFFYVSRPDETMEWRWVKITAKFHPIDGYKFGYGRTREGYLIINYEEFINNGNRANS